MSKTKTVPREDQFLNHLRGKGVHNQSIHKKMKDAAFTDSEIDEMMASLFAGGRPTPGSRDGGGVSSF